MMANLLPAIFTLDIGGKPALTFEAKNLREAWEAPPSGMRRRHDRLANNRFSRGRMINARLTPPLKLKPRKNRIFQSFH
jgi:hypothetical protein